MNPFLESWLRRFMALFDKSAWMLIAPAMIVLAFLDPPMAKMLAQWSLFFLVLTGVAIVISRIVFPNINLTEFVRSAIEDHNAAAGAVAAAVVNFVGLLIVAAVLWVKS